jgi:hypothetical protein
MLRCRRAFPLLLAVPVALVAAGACGGGDDDAPDGSSSDAGAAGAMATPIVVLDGGGEVGPPPGGPEACPTGPCNYQTQSGCGTGSACRPQLADATDTATPSCAHVAGASGAGENCASWNDCSRGTLCVGGKCRTLCCGGDWSVCAEGESCYGTLAVRSPATGNVVPASVNVCLPVGSCDVFDETSCRNSELACQIVDGRGSVGCVPAGSAGFGDACQQAFDCAPGFACAGDAGRTVCRRLCRATAEGGEPTCPPAEGACVHLAWHPPGVGECRPYGF